MKKFKLVKAIAFATIAYAGYKTAKKYKELSQADVQKEKSVVDLLGESIPTKEDVKKDVENVKSFVNEKVEGLKAAKEECFFDDSDDDDEDDEPVFWDDLDKEPSQPASENKEEEPQEEKKNDKNLGAIKLHSCLPDDEPEKEE